MIWGPCNKRISLQNNGVTRPSGQTITKNVQEKQHIVTQRCPMNGDLQKANCKHIHAQGVHAPAFPRGLSTPHGVAHEQRLFLKMIIATFQSLEKQ
eukprot:1159527-Pelagomonas_calceolata.AAC.4